MTPSRQRPRAQTSAALSPRSPKPHADVVDYALARGCILVAASEIRYLRPLFHRAEPVPIDVWVTKIGAASFALGYQVYDADGTVYATAASTMVVAWQAWGRSGCRARSSP